MSTDENKPARPIEFGRPEQKEDEEKEATQNTGGRRSAGSYIDALKNGELGI